MALGMFEKKTAPVVDTNNTSDGASNGASLPVYDSEKQGYNGRNMHRVAPPLPGMVSDADSESELSVEKQLELESTNSIKYRTCSWQKVIPILSSPSQSSVDDAEGALDVYHKTGERDILGD